MFLFVLAYQSHIYNRVARSWDDIAKCVYIKHFSPPKNAKKCLLSVAGQKHTNAFLIRRLKVFIICRPFYTFRCILFCLGRNRCQNTVQTIRHNLSYCKGVDAKWHDVSWLVYSARTSVEHHYKWSSIIGISSVTVWLWGDSCPPNFPLAAPLGTLHFGLGP